MKDERFPDLHEGANVPHLLDAQLRFIDHVDFLRSHTEFSQTMQRSAVRQPRVELINAFTLADGIIYQIHIKLELIVYIVPVDRKSVV